MRKYKLSCEYIDSESGCDFFHVMKIENGEVLKDQEYDYFSIESINHYGADFFFEEYRYIFEEVDLEMREEVAERVKIFNQAGITAETLKEWGMADIYMENVIDPTKGNTVEVEGVSISYTIEKLDTLYGFNNEDVDENDPSYGKPLYNIKAYGVNEDGKAMYLDHTGIDEVLLIGEMKDYATESFREKLPKENKGKGEISSPAKTTSPKP